MNRVSCAAKTIATYSASQELSATQAFFIEAQDTTLLTLYAFKQKQEVDFLSFSSVAQSESEYPKSSNAVPLLKTKVRLVDPLK